MATDLENDLNGLAKEIYGQLVKAVPEAGLFLRMVAFDEGQRLGNLFHEPVILTHEHGYTYGGNDTSAFSLESPISMVMKDAQVGAYTYLLQSAISTTAASRARKTGPAAFKSAISVLMANALESSTKRLEISALYGQSGIGQVADDDAFASDTSTTATLQLTSASWAAGIWSGSEGAELHLYDSDDGTTLISSGDDAVFTITNVVNSAKQLKISGTSTGITALVTAVQGGGVDLYYKGSRTNDMLGIRSIFSNTGSLFNIDAASYGMWRGNSFDAAGALSMEKVLTYVSDLVGRGLSGDVTLMCSPATWKDLNNEQSALRVYDSSYAQSKATNGFQDIVYHGQSGKVKVVANPCVKEGEAFLFQPKDVKRVGSAENDSNISTQDQNPFIPLPSNAGFSFRIYSDQAVYCRRPARCAVVTGIVNQA